MGEPTKYVHRYKNPGRLFQCFIKCRQSCVGGSDREPQLASSQTRLETRHTRGRGPWPWGGPWDSLLVAVGVSVATVLSLSRPHHVQLLFISLLLSLHSNTEQYQSEYGPK